MAFTQSVEARQVAILFVHINIAQDINLSQAKGIDATILDLSAETHRQRPAIFGIVTIVPVVAAKAKVEIAGTG